jgi:peptidoglycan/LPS O-acetylase OafA/YrhL
MKIKYRPEIDGLRAVAVISVILYHSKIFISGREIFIGGFLGVDIFFVISGYLITSLILKELITTNSFSFMYFYERRIRRIIPALLFVMLFSIPFAWIYLLPSHFIDFSKQILLSLGFGSNFYFHYSEQNYGGWGALLKPFLHTWSLSVEEQFYIIYPLCFMIIFNYFRKNLGIILIILIFISLLLADLTSRHNTSLSFYFLTTRIWELCAGALLAVLELKHSYKNQNKYLSLVLPSTGFLLILYSIFFFNFNNPHPSIYTLPPIIGTCLIIFFSNKYDLVTKVLSSKLFVGVGLISYSLYLWHFPIFAFNRITKTTNDILINEIILALIVILLSILTYFIIEKPFRNKKNNFKFLFSIIFLSIISLVIFNTSALKSGFAFRFDKIYKYNNLDAEILRKKSWKNAGDITKEGFFRKKYYKEIKDNFIDISKTNILIVGDSNSKDMLNIFIENKNLFSQYEFSRFPFLFRENVSEEIDKLKKNKIFSKTDVILISDFYSIEHKEIEGVNKFIKSLKKEKKIILTSLSNIYNDEFSHKNFTRLTIFDHYLLKKNNKFVGIDENLTKEDQKKINRLYYKNRKVDFVKNINKTLKKISEENNIKFLNKEDFLCDIKHETCFGITDKYQKIYIDSVHYTIEGAKFLGEIIYKTGWFKIN